MDIAKKATEPFDNPVNDDYELLPHKDILELKEELRKLRAQPSEKTLQISMVELSGRINRLIDIFEEAKEMIKAEEGALTFQEKMKPLLNRMDKVLEQNSQIAEGVVAIADMVNELKDMLGGTQKKTMPFNDFESSPMPLPESGMGIPPPPSEE